MTERKKPKPKPKATVDPADMHEILLGNPAWLAIDGAEKSGWSLYWGDKHWYGTCDPDQLQDEIPFDRIPDGVKFLVSIERGFYGDSSTWGDKSKPKCGECGEPIKAPWEKKFKGPGKKGAVTMLETQGYIVATMVSKLRGRLAAGMWRPTSSVWRPILGIPNRRAEGKAMAIALCRGPWGCDKITSDDVAEAIAINQAAIKTVGLVFPVMRKKPWHEVKG